MPSVKRVGSVVVKPLATYTAGTYPIIPTPIDDALTHFRLDIQRCTSADPTVWPLNTDSIDIELTCSTNGAPFEPLGSGSDTGGIVTNPKTHVEVPSMYIDCELPQGANRIIGGSASLSADIKTSVTVTVS